MQEDKPLHRNCRAKPPETAWNPGSECLTIDMSNRFGVLPIAEEDQHYFAFMTVTQNKVGLQEIVQRVGE